MEITSETALAEAAGRIIVVGEHHTDRRARDAMLNLIRAAQPTRYQTLGVEVSLGGTGKYWGLLDELKFIRQHGQAPLTEHDRRSYIDRDHFWQRKRRLNRHWMIQRALAQDWNVVPIDPCHWHWERDDEEAYFGGRECTMIEAINDAFHWYGPLIVNCGLIHLEALRVALGYSAYCVLATRIEDVGEQRNREFADRIAAARKLPLLLTPA